MTFEQVFTYVTLGVTVAHKLVDVAKWLASQTARTDDDALVARAEGWLGAASNLLAYVPAVRMGAKK